MEKTKLLKKIIKTQKAPAAIGPYSQAVKVGKLVFCSGQIALDPQTGGIVGTTIQKQAQQVLENLSQILKAAGSSLDKVVKTTIYLKNIDEFAQFNQVYEKYFANHKPARATVEVSRLPKNALVEIDAIALT